MDKYTEIIKAMAECAGPDCGLTCPYKDKSAGGKSCRALLLEDAMQAIVGEEARADAAEADRNRLIDDAANLEAAYKTVREEREELDKALTCVIQHRDELLHAKDTLRERCQVQQNEINALVLKLGKQEDETDRPSVCSDDMAKQIGELVAHANYQQGRADTLAEIVARCSFGGGGRHD